MIDLKQICRTLETKRCRTHNEKTTATVSGKSIKLSCCCDKFQKELENQIDNEVAKQVDKGIDDAFKGF